MTPLNVARRPFAAVLILIAGCGGGPAAPTGPQYPEVAGTYTGALTLSL